MTTATLVAIGAGLCGIWAGVTIALITAHLNERGIKTSWPLMRWYVIRNVRLYREETLKANGKVGLLFYSFLISINAVWLLALLALAAR